MVADRKAAKGDGLMIITYYGHSLFALLAGWFGGQLARRLCRASRAQEPSAAVNLEGTTP
jgi:hypothetical protein